MHIGLIGGIGPAATDLYYRGLIQRAEESAKDLDLTIAHASSPTLLRHLAAEEHDAQSAIYLRLTERLARAGAECVAVTSISGHFCIDSFAPRSPLPVLDMMGALRTSLASAQLTTVGLMGTKTVMETSMYGKLGDVEVLVPPNLDAVHDAYVELARTARPTEAIRRVLFAAGRALMDGGQAQAVLLGGTDMNIAFDGQDCGFPLVDCAGIHVEAIARNI
ncbi:MAG: aspartate/glutamate racemase family protein [Myxococcota bacterium]